MNTSTIDSAHTISAPPKSAPDSHLEKQRIQLQERIDKLQAERDDANRVLGAATAPVQEELGVLDAGLRKIYAEGKSALFEAALAQSTWKCLDLKQLATTPWKWGINPVFGAWFLVLAVFSLLMFVLPAWGLASLLLAAGGAAFIYWQFFNRARAEFARQTSMQSVAALALVGSYRPAVIQLGKTPSGNKDFPYHCVQVSFAGKSFDGARSFNSKVYGDMFGATLIGFVSDTMANGVDFWIKLPEDGQALRWIDLSDKAQETARFELVGPALEELLRQRSTALAQTMHAMSAHAASRRAADGELAILKARMQTLSSQEAAWRNVAVNRDALDQIVIQIELFKLGRAGAPKGMLLYGPPGTGKTSIARNLADSSGCQFVAVNLADLKGQFQGHTAPAVVNIWKKARSKAPCILFIDECEGILGTRSERSASGHNVNFDNELVETFLAEWDGMNSSAGQVFVVGATNRRENLDSAIVSRFNQMIEIGLPDVQSRKRILDLEFGKRNIAMPVTEKMAKETAGMSGRDLSNLATSFQGATLLDEPSETMFTGIVKQTRGKASTMTDGVRWDQVVLPARVKTKLEGLARKIKRAEEYQKAGFPVPKSLLLYGPPGTGKTQIARALATESGLAFQAVTTSEVKGSHIGESGKRMRQIFETARGQAPCLLFIDEIDIVTARRGEGDSYSQEIIGQLLQEMDGVKSRAGAGFVFLLAATNCVEKIDEAVLSRFGEKEEIGLPDTDARADILEVLLGNKPLGFALPAILPKLAAATEGMSGRDLNSLVSVAANHAMHRADLEGLEIEDIRILESDFVGSVVAGRTIVLD